MQALLLTLIRAYQVAVSPLLGPRCRFYPSCSEYAVQALARFGLVRGLALAGWRLVRCHPFHPGGLDPCPGEDAEPERPAGGGAGASRGAERAR